MLALFSFFSSSIIPAAIPANNRQHHAPWMGDGDVWNSWLMGPSILRLTSNKQESKEGRGLRVRGGCLYSLHLATLHHPTPYRYDDKKEDEDTQAGSLSERLREGLKNKPCALGVLAESLDLLLVLLQGFLQLSHMTRNLSRPHKVVRSTVGSDYLQHGMHHKGPPIRSNPLQDS